MACQVCAGRNDARHDWATSWLIFPLRVVAAALDLPSSFVLLEQPEDLGAVATGRRPSSMWQRPLFRDLVDHSSAQHVVFHQADFGTPYPKPTRLLLKSTQVLYLHVCAGGFRTLIPRVSTLARCLVTPRRGPCRPLGRHPSARLVRNSGPRLSASGWRGASAPTSAPRLALGIMRRRLRRRLRRQTRRWGKERSFASTLCLRQGLRMAWTRLR